MIYKLLNSIIELKNNCSNCSSEDITNHTTKTLCTSSHINNNDYYSKNQSNQYQWPILLLSIFVLLGFTGNLLVCLAIKFYPKLQNATNYYLFSLAATDLLVAILVIPLAIVKEFFKTWILGNITCMIWVFFDVLLCTTSIMLLCVISCERYVGIHDPLKNREKSKTKTKLIIVIVWFLSILLSSPVLVLGILDSSNIIQNGNCMLFNTYFIIYGSIFSFVIPLIIMVIMYALTVNQLSKIVKEFKKKSKVEETKTTASKNKINNNIINKKIKNVRQLNNLTKFRNTINSGLTNGNERKNLKSVKKNVKNRKFSHSSFFNYFCCYKSQSLTISTNNNKNNNKRNDNNNTFDKKVSQSFILPQIQLTHEVPLNAVNDNVKKSNELSSCERKSFSYLSLNSTELASSMESDNLTKNTVFTRKHTGGSIRKLSSEKSNSTGTNVTVTTLTSEQNRPKLKLLVNKHRLLTRAIAVFQSNRESSAVKNEQKAVKVLGIVFVIFVIAWAPFAFVNMLSAFCDKCYIHPLIMNSLVWLGYISSCLNPLIYNAFNEKFRFAFKSILKCDIQNLHRHSFKRQTNLLIKQHLLDTDAINNLGKRNYSITSKPCSSRSSRNHSEILADQNPHQQALIQHLRQTSFSQPSSRKSSFKQKKQYQIKAFVQTEQFQQSSPEQEQTKYENLLIKPKFIKLTKLNNSINFNLSDTTKT